MEKYFHWDIDPILFSLGSVGPFGNIEVRWYGLLFVIGLMLAVTAMTRIFRDRGLPEADASTVSWWLPIGMLVGAHLIHLIFYEPRSFIDHPARILQIGRGLASHGGALGVIVTTWLFAKKRGRPFHEYMDAIMVPCVWVFPWVRIANFFNSEIVGHVTTVPWAVVFDRVDPANARHPVVLYEALAGFVLLGIAEWMHRNLRNRLRQGALFYFVLMLYFSYRFALEFWKESQGIDDGWKLNMGHLLSIGPVVYCAAMLFATKRFRLLPLLSEEEAAAKVAAQERESAAIAAEETKPAGSSKSKRRKKK